jgi:hypothetical protein
MPVQWRPGLGVAGAGSGIDDFNPVRTYPAPQESKSHINGTGSPRPDVIGSARHWRRPSVIAAPSEASLAIAKIETVENY